MSLLPTAAVWKVDAGFAAGWAGVVCAAYFLVVVPAQQSQFRTAAEHATLAARQEEAVAAEKGRDRLQSQLQSTRASLDRFSLVLLHVSEQNRRLPDLTRLAQDHRLQITEQSSKPAVVEGGFARIPITMAGSATFSDAAAFIADLHERFRDTQVAGFSLRAAADDSGMPGSRALCHFDLVWFADPSPGAKPSQVPGPAGRESADPAAPAQIPADNPG